MNYVEARDQFFRNAFNEDLETVRDFISIAHQYQILPLVNVLVNLAFDQLAGSVVDQFQLANEYPMLIGRCIATHIHSFEDLARFSQESNKVSRVFTAKFLLGCLHHFAPILQLK